MGSNEEWAGDINYIKTAKGWVHFSIVKDLFSRRIVRWH